MKEEPFMLFDEFVLSILEDKLANIRIFTRVILVSLTKSEDIRSPKERSCITIQLK